MEVPGFLFLIFGLLCGRLGAFFVPWFCLLFKDEETVTYSLRTGIRKYCFLSEKKTTTLNPVSEEDLLKDKSFAEGFKAWQKHWAGPFPLASVLGFFWKRKGKAGVAVIEIVTALLFWLLYLKFWGDFIFWEYLIFVWASTIACFIDLKKMILPDQITLTGILIGLLGAWLNPERAFSDALGGVLLGGGGAWAVAVLYFLATKKEGIGGGDIKLLGWIGALLGWKAIMLIIMLSSTIGILMALILFSLFSSASQDKNSSWIAQPFAFGPSLVLASFLFIFFHDTLKLNLDFLYL